MDRLTERNPYWMGEEFWTSARKPDDEEIDKVYGKLVEYENAEEDGLLVRLPFKLGDKIYFPHRGRVEPFKIVSITQCEYGMEMSAWYDGEDDLKKYWSITVCPEDIGNKFYKTKNG